MPLAHKIRDAQGKRGLQPDDTAGRLGERLGLLLGGMRRVVGGDDVDCTVLQALDDGVTVRLRSQRRVHLRHRALLQHGVLGQREMMRRCLGRHVRAHLLRQAHQLHGVRRADVLDVHPRARVQRQHAVARHQHVLGQCRSAAQAQLFGYFSLVHTGSLDKGLVFLMKGQRYVQPLGLFHGSLGQFLIHQRDAVVGKSRGPVGGKLLHVHQLAALHAAAEHVAERLRVVHGRLRVRHAHHAGEPACRGRRGAAFDVLLVREPRVAEVHVHVHQPRSHHAALRLDDALVVLRALVLADLRYLAAVYHQVEHIVDAARRVDDAAVFHQDHSASSFKCSYITIAPSRIDSMVANSFLLWLMPFTHGMNTMPVSQICANDMAS